VASASAKTSGPLLLINCTSNLQRGLAAKAVPGREA